MPKMKIVAGTPCTQNAFRAAGAALEKGYGPDYVDKWLAWFDGRPCDHIPIKSDKECAGCIDKVTCDVQQKKLGKENKDEQ